MSLEANEDAKITLFEVGVFILAVLLLAALLLWALGPEWKRQQRQEALASEALRAISCMTDLAFGDSTLTAERAWWICHPLEDQKP